MFAEAVIQMHLSFLLIGSITLLDIKYNKIWHDTVQEEKAFLGWLGDNKWLIWLSFSISFFSATFGLTKFLKTGPVKIVNHTSEIGQVPLVGFGITMVIIASFMISKAVWVFLNEEKYYTNGGESIPVGLGEPSLISQVFLFWLLFSMIPQILMVSQLDLMKKSFIYFLLLRL